MRIPCGLCARETSAGRMPRHLAAHRIFWTKVTPSDACWLWTGATSAFGYPVVGGQWEPYAHRRAYVWSVGPIPDGYEVDHLCRVKLCVRPDHLEPVTKAENIRRQNALTSGSAQRARTHCPQGHPYSGRNLHIRPDGARSCNECRRQRVRAWRANQRGVAA